MSSRKRIRRARSGRGPGPAGVGVGLVVLEGCLGDWSGYCGRFGGVVEEGAWGTEGGDGGDGVV